MSHDVLIGKGTRRGGCGGGEVEGGFCAVTSWAASSRRSDRRGWVQWRDLFTHELQNPHSPSLQTSHCQYHPLAKSWHMSQNTPVCSRSAGSSVVCIASLPFDLTIDSGGGLAYRRA